MPPTSWPEGLLELPAGTFASGQVGSIGTPPSPGQPGTGRGRRRALLRGQDGLPDRPVLLEWFSGPDLPVRVVQAHRRLGLCHVHLLRLLRVEQPEPAMAYALSEAPAGVELSALLRLARARSGLPPWWSVAVVHATGRGLLALHQHLAARRAPARHGALSPAALFVGWQGEVQLQCFTALPEGTETMALPVPAGPAADVHALCRLLLDLLPRDARGEQLLSGLLDAGLSPDPARRPQLAELLAGLEAALLDLDVPPERTRAIGQQVTRLFPQQAGAELSDLTDMGLGDGGAVAGPAARETPVAGAVAVEVPAPPAVPLRRAGRCTAFSSLWLMLCALLLGAGLYYGAAAIWPSGPRAPVLILPPAAGHDPP